MAPGWLPNGPNMALGMLEEAPQETPEATEGTSIMILVPSATLGTPREPLWALPMPSWGHLGTVLESI